MVKSTYITLYIYMYKNVHIYVLFNLAFSREFYGGIIILNILRNFILHMVFSSRKLKHATTHAARAPPRPPRWQRQLPNPPHQTKSAALQSILARLGRVKWQNLSTAINERVDHLINAVVVPARPQNRPYND
jgi:hypothetical protein